MTRETRRRARSTDSQSTTGSLYTTNSLYTTGSLDTTSTLDTILSQDTVPPNDDFTRLMFYESRPPSPSETALEYRFQRFSDDYNPEIPEAAKTAIRDRQAQIHQYQRLLQGVEAKIQKLQKHEVELQDQITENKKGIGEALLLFKAQHKELTETATTHDNVSIEALGNLQAGIAQKSSTKILKALQQIQTELRRRTRPKQQEKARLQQEVRAITPDDDIDGVFLEFIYRDHQLDANMTHDFDNPPSTPKDQKPPTPAEIRQTLINKMEQEYEAARLQLRETLNIDGLFEEMSNRQESPPAHSERGEQLPGEMQRTQEEPERLRDHPQTKQGRLSKEEQVQLERMMGITSAEYPIRSDYPPSLEKLPPEIHEDVKNILDHMQHLREARAQYEEIIDQQQTIASMTQEIETEAPTYSRLQRLMVRPTPNETPEAYHQRLVDLLPSEVPEHIQQTEHWQQLHLTYTDYLRTHRQNEQNYIQMQQEALTGLKRHLLDRDWLATHLQNIEQRRKAEQDLPNIQEKIVNLLVANIAAYPLNTLSPEVQTKIRGMRDHTQLISLVGRPEEIIDQQQTIAFITRELETEAPTYRALQFLTKESAAYQAMEAYHSWLVDLLPSNVPEHIQQTDHWQLLHLTYTDYLRTHQPNQLNYIQMKQEALTRLKHYLEARDRFLTDPQNIERQRRAEQNLSNIQEDIVNLLVATIADSSLKKLSQEAQTTIRDMRDHSQPINAARKPYEEITDQLQQQMIAHIMREIETEAPTYSRLQRLTGQSAANETPEAYHRRLLNLLPSRVPEHIQQTKHWQRLHLTYTDYTRSDPQPQLDHYVQMKQEALSSLRQHLLERSQIPTHLQELKKRRTENQKFLKTFQELELEAPTYLKFQRLTEQQAPYNTMEAYHWWITSHLPSEVPEHIQQTEQWQRLHLTYTDYARNDPPSQQNYIQMKQEALISLRDSIEYSNQLLTRLQHFEKLRAKNQELLKTIQWSTENRRADTILKRLSTHYGSHTENWSTFKRSLSTYLEAERNSQVREKRYWDNIARKGKAISQKNTAPTALDQALLHAHEMHPWYRERISDWEYQILQDVAVLTDIPQEQRRALSEISNDTTRTLLERATQMKSLLSTRREGLQARIHTFKDEITANRTTSRIAAQLVATVHFQKERATAHKQKEGKLHETQEHIQVEENLRHVLVHDIVTAQTHITTIQTSIKGELDTITDKQRKALQKTREDIQEYRKEIIQQFDIHSNKKTHKDVLDALTFKYNQYSKALAENNKGLILYDKIIDKSEKTLRDLENPESSMYLRYSRDLIDSLQSKIDEHTAKVTQEYDRIVNFFKKLDLATDRYKKPTDEIAVDQGDITNNISTIELDFIDEINHLNEQKGTSYRILENLSLARYFTQHPSSDDDRAFFDEVRSRIAEEPSHVHTIEYTFWWHYYPPIYKQLAACIHCTKILDAKKEKHASIQEQTNEQIKQAEISKSSLLEKRREMEQEQEKFKKMRNELSSRVRTQIEEEKRFDRALKQVDNIKEEIASLHPIDTE